MCWYYFVMKLKPTHRLGSRKLWWKTNEWCLSRDLVMTHVNPSFLFSNLISLDAINWRNKQSQLYFVAYFIPKMASFISADAFHSTSVRLSFFANKGRAFVTSSLCKKKRPYHDRQGGRNLTNPQCKHNKHHHMAPGQRCNDRGRLLPCTAQHGHGGIHGSATRSTSIHQVPECSSPSDVCWQCPSKHISIFVSCSFLSWVASSSSVVWLPNSCQRWIC